MADHKLLPLLIATIVLWSTLAGNAQDKHALVQKLFEVSEVSNQIKAGALTATEPIMDHIRKSNPDLPEDTFNYIQSKIQGELLTEMATFMDEWAYPLIENDYSAEELQYIIQFYSSETGQKLVHKMPTVMQQMMSHLPEFLQQSVPKIRDAAVQAAAEKNYKLHFDTQTR
jgi:uncharacterized protein